jgi:hypothetical protein
MSTRFFSSPRTASAAAAIAPARLAAAPDTAVRWRTGSDGALEVLTVRDGRADRLLVNDDGTTAPLDSFSPSFWHRRGNRVVILGWSICFVSIVVGGLSGLSVVLAGWAVGAAIFVGGGIAHQRAQNLDRWFGGGWHEPTDLHGWVPRSGAQLAAVEQIADDHDGLAYLRDTGGRTVDVYATREGQLVLHWVDERGDTGVTSIERYAAPYRLDRLLKWLSGLLWIALLAVLFVVDEHKFLLAGAIGVSIAVVVLAGVRNSRHVELGGLMSRRGHDRSEWIEIRTRLVEDDGD